MSGGWSFRQKKEMNKEGKKGQSAADEKEEAGGACHCCKATYFS